MKKLTKEDVDKMVLSYLDKSKQPAAQGSNLLNKLMGATKPVPKEVE